MLEVDFLPSQLGQAPSSAASSSCFNPQWLKLFPRAPTTTGLKQELEAAQPFIMKVRTERDPALCHPGMILSTLQKILWWLRLTSSLLGPNPTLPQVEKEWINVWRADWVTVGSHQRSHSSQQRNAISPMAPCHHRGQNIYWREVSNLKVICAFQKMAALTLINNRLAQLKPCWSR